METRLNSFSHLAHDVSALGVRGTWVKSLEQKFLHALIALSCQRVHMAAGPDSTCRNSLVCDPNSMIQESNESLNSLFSNGKCFTGFELAVWEKWPVEARWSKLDWILASLLVGFI